MPVARSGSLDCVDAGGAAAGAGQRPVPDAEERAEEQESSQQQQAACRVCWAEDDDDAGGSLIAPCSCSGTQKWVHERCLREWQATQLLQGMPHRARMCEVCKTPYRNPEYLHQIPVMERRRRRFVAWLRLLVAQATDAQSIARMALRLWRAYVFMSGLHEAGRLGYKGLVIGVQLGQSLVKEQASIMVQLLSRLAKLLGSPYAELLWTQAAAAMALGLASEFLYTTVIGLVTGTVYGFVRGYTGAVGTSALLVRQGCARGLVFLLKAMGRAGGAVSSGVMRVPGALPGWCRFLCRLGRVV